MAEAANSCTLTTNPSPVKITTKTVDLTIKSNNFVDGHEYRVKMNNQDLGYFSDAPMQTRVGFKQKSTNQTISVTNVNGAGIINPWPGFDREFSPGTYTVSIYTVDTWTGSGQFVCNVSFSTDNGPTSSSCYIEFITQNCTPEQGVAFYAHFYDKSKPSDSHRIILRRGGRNGDTLPPDDLAASTSQLDPDLGGKGVDLGKSEPGTYYLEVRDSFGIKGAGEGLACNQFFTIYPSGSQIGCGIGTTSSSNIIWGDVQPPAGERPICKSASIAGKTNFICDTAIGDINTDPNLFVTKIFGFLLGISGGIALLLIIVSGYKYMASQGNPEKIQGAKEALTSAIVGLLFIIFSFVILEVIGVDLLKIPGLTK